MDRHRLFGTDSRVHEILRSSYNGRLIAFTCDAPFSINDVLVYGCKPDPTRLTDDEVTCPGCLSVMNGAAPHPDDLSREIADAVLAETDRRGRVPVLANENLRLMFEALIRGAGDDEERIRYEILVAQYYAFHMTMYDLVRQHLDDLLTDRARVVPEGTPEVLVRYMRYTGGDVMVPVGVGDRLVSDGLASGHWDHCTVTAVDPDGINIEMDWGWRGRYAKDEVRRAFSFKTNSPPVPATA